MISDLGVFSTEWKGVSIVEGLLSLTENQIIPHTKHKDVLKQQYRLTLLQ